jgi:hypothetical protein
MGLAPLDPRPFDALPVDENNPKEKSITELEYETWRTPGIQKAVQHGPCSRCTISSPSAGLHVSYDLVNHTFLAMILPPQELLGCDCGFYFSIHRKQLVDGDGIVFEVVCTKRDWRAC